MRGDEKKGFTGSQAISSSYFLSSTNVHSLVKNAGIFVPEYSYDDSGIMILKVILNLKNWNKIELTKKIYVLEIELDK